MPYINDYIRIHLSNIIFILISLIIISGLCYIYLQLKYPESISSSNDKAMTLGVSICVTIVISIFNNYYKLNICNIIALSFILLLSLIMIRLIEFNKKISFSKKTYQDKGLSLNRLPLYYIMETLILNILPAITIYILIESIIDKKLNSSILDNITTVFLVLYFALISFLLLIALKIKSVITDNS